VQEPTILDKAFHIIIKRMVETGQAPFYTELASELGLSVEEGRKTLHDLFSAGIAGWLYPRTDHIASFGPFSNLPTQYRITIDGQQKWFGQWGFESLAVCWLFPGKTVTVDFPCLDCGESLRVVIRDGKLLNEEASGYTAYTPVPVWKWLEDLGYAWSTMNLFRSEEHVRHWASFVEGSDEGIVSLLDMSKVVSGPFLARRMDQDYLSHMSEYVREGRKIRKEIGITGSFWEFKKP
jgi:hypothetical protein